MLTLLTDREAPKAYCTTCQYRERKKDGEGLLSDSCSIWNCLCVLQMFHGKTCLCYRERKKPWWKLW